MPKMLWVDPRPDLEEDHEAWQQVLRRATFQGFEVMALLHGLRQYGARLSRTQGGYKISPRYRREGGGWTDNQEWLVDRAWHLVPAADKLEKVLTIPRGD